MSETFPVAKWPPPVTSTPLAISFEQPTRKAKEKKKCGDCGVMFNRYHECRPKKDEKCKYCQRILPFKNVKNHEKKCKIFHKYVEFGNEDGTRVRCKVCPSPRLFITQAAVFCHLQRIHAELFVDDVAKVKFNCHTCNQSFNYRFQLKKHAIVCGAAGNLTVGKQEKKFDGKKEEGVGTTCQICYTTYSKASMAKHAKVCKAYQNLIYGSTCLVCNKEFAMRRGLLIHVRSQHRDAFERNQRNLAQKKECGHCKETIEIKYFEQHQQCCRIRQANQKAYQKLEPPSRQAQVPKETDPLRVPNRKCNLCNETVARNNFTFHYETCTRAFTFVQDTVCKICKLRWGSSRDVLLHVLDAHPATVAADDIEIHDDVVEEENEEENNQRALVQVPVVGGGEGQAVQRPRQTLDFNNNRIISELPSRNSRYQDRQSVDPFNISKLVICPICTGKFAFKEDLFNHMSQYHRVPAARCLNIGLQYRIINV